MTATKPIDVFSPFIKQQEEIVVGDSNDDNSLDEIDNLLSLSLPSISRDNCILPTDPNDGFLRLTTMVRAVYLSYLHKCLLSNYVICCDRNNVETACNELRKCADEMELNAVRQSLEASVYRQNMLKLISDIKAHSSEKKIFKKLAIFLETPSRKVDIGVQTDYTRVDNTSSNVQKADSTQDDNTGNGVPIAKLIPLYSEEANTNLSEAKVELDPSCDKDIADRMFGIFEDSHGNVQVSDHAQIDLSKIINNENIQDDDGNSQDSLLQHMEDMFCESEDSSDLTTLIEKHSGVSKANIDKEISEMCPDTSIQGQSNAQSKHIKTNAIKMPCTSQGRLSFNHYKEMKSRGIDKTSKSNKIESKHKQRLSGIWFVERVYQVSKLKTKMTELSLRNYRKHGRIKQKFIELFGESDSEDMMPDSPICIEEHLTSCKERIAPWIVKYLMPFYKKRRIKDRQLFKAVAKHITDMLIIENTFPEESCVSRYVENYFKNKKFIKAKQDIYL